MRKGSDAATNKQSDRHAIESNLLAHAGCGSTSAADASVYVGGGDFARIVGNDCRNPGMPGALGYGIYLQGLGGATTAGAVVVGNTIHDDRTATHPHGAAGMLNGIRINLVAGGTAPSDATLGPNAVTGSTGAAISDTGGTNTHQYSETTHNHSGTGAGALTLPLPRWIPGRYYGTRAQVATGTNAGQALTANQAIATPFYAPDAYAVVEIACSITTVVAGSKVRMAIYLANETDGRPASLVVQTGDLSGATLGKLAATIATTLQAQSGIGRRCCPTRRSRSRASPAASRT